jgi:hypothetical protein
MFDQSVLHRREKLAGKSGLAGLLKGAHAFRITLFTSIGGYCLLSSYSFSSRAFLLDGGLV